ncbi:hypothetical protein L9F63_017138 [Diploptera punctata]|uniref:Kinetochore protein NDC80 n=1 Tax=Diploptera punctata TaxID=6984 RepID=A0AAD8EH15_DIPPU|nr:hypothetical protein L9F63_017138 [Diploptera punctata]
MRKSSLGKRSSSLAPLLNIPESSNNAANRGVQSRNSAAQNSQMFQTGAFAQSRNSAVQNSQMFQTGALTCRKTMIPQPSKSRLSRDSNNPPTSVPSAKVSSTPLGVPSMPRMYGSVVKNNRLQLSKKPIKDVRLLTDKNFQVLVLQKIYSYFRDNDGMDISKVPKTLSGCSFTLKTFVEMAQHFFSKIFPNENITMANYTEKIPTLAKRVAYPNVVKKSWLVTANSSHSLPQVIGLLSWLLDLVKSESNVSELMFPPEDQIENMDNDDEDDDDDSSFNFHSSERMFLHYVEGYSKFCRNQNYEAAVEKMVQEANNKLGTNDDDFKIIQNTLSKLQQELERPEILQILEEQREVENTKAKLSNEMYMFAKSLHQKVTYIDEKEEDIEKMQCYIPTLIASNEKCIESISKTSKHVETQPYSREDIERMEEKCKELELNIKLDETTIDMWDKENYTLDIQMARVREKLNVVLKDYTTPLVKKCRYISRA